MRRLVSLVAAALLTMAIAAPALAAGPPEKVRLEPTYLDPSVFEGSCEFDVELQDSFAASNEFVFPVDEDGNQRVMYTGGFRSTLTNVDDDISVDISYFGHLEYLYRADGSIVVRVSGQALWWLADPVDASMYGLTPGIYIITGRVESVTDANLIATEPAKVRGQIRDLCAELAPG